MSLGVASPFGPAPMVSVEDLLVGILCVREVVGSIPCTSENHLPLMMQESLLGEDVLGDLRGDLVSPSSPSLSGPFPCLADELQEQVKALEGAW